MICLESPESLEKYWDKYYNALKDDSNCIKEPFLMFPKGTNDFEICEWFNKMYPDGLLALMKKRMTKKFGEEYVKNWDNFRKQLHSVDVAPDFARIRELQANLRGQRALIQLVDEAACLTAEE